MVQTHGGVLILFVSAVYGLICGAQTLNLKLLLTFFDSLYDTTYFFPDLELLDSTSISTSQLNSFNRIVVYFNQIFARSSASGK